MDILAELEKRVGVMIQDHDLQPRTVGYKDILDAVATGIYFVDRKNYGKYQAICARRTALNLVHLAKS